MDKDPFTPLLLLLPLHRLQKNCGLSIAELCLSEIQCVGPVQSLDEVEPLNFTHP